MMATPALALILALLSAGTTGAASPAAASSACVSYLDAAPDDEAVWICEAQDEALPYMTPAASTAVLRDTSAINDTDHGNASIPTKPELFSVETWDVVLFLVVSLICFMEALNART